LAGGFVDGELQVDGRENRRAAGDRVVVPAAIEKSTSTAISAVGRLLSFGQGADADESFRLSQSGAHSAVRL